jgi:hypothetical protein
MKHILWSLLQLSLVNLSERLAPFTGLHANIHTYSHKQSVLIIDLSFYDGHDAADNIPAEIDSGWQF